jgi:hypothetical protein
VGDVRWAVWLLWLVVACAPARVAAPPPGPPLGDPSDAIPADLDLAIRLDVAKMRRALPLAELGKLELPDHDDLITRALGQADTVWIALRPEAGLADADNVLVLRGRFSGFDPRRPGPTPPFVGERDLGGGWRLYRRDAPTRRAAPAQIYARHEDLLVFVSTAEIDSTERAIEKRQRGEPVIPPARGAVAVAARVAPLRAWLSNYVPTLAKALRHATRLAAHADLNAAGLEAELEVQFESADQAIAARDTVSRLARTVSVSDGFAGRVARRLRIESVAEALVVRLLLDDRELAELVACGSSGRCTSKPRE